MKTKYLLLPVLILAGGALSASAQVAAQDDDLILGFANSSGTGSSLNLEVDLGNVGSFYNTSGTEQLTGLVDADLVATYGANWNTLSTLTWGVAGTTGSGQGTTINSNSIAAATIWGTAAETTLGSQSAAWSSGSVFAQRTAANAIANLYSAAPVGLNLAAATGNSSHASVLATSDSGSWSHEFGTNAAAFTYFNPSNLFTTGVNGVSDLYELQPSNGAGAYLGSFSLTSNGQFFYSSSVNLAANTVPEPSTYAVILGVIALGFVAWRRRQPARA